MSTTGFVTVNGSSSIPTGAFTPMPGSILSNLMAPAMGMGYSVPATSTGVYGTGAGSMSSGSWADGLMGNISLGTSIGSAIGSMFSSFFASEAAEYVLEKQAELNKINEGKMQFNVENAFRTGESQIAKVTSQAGAIKAKQRTSMAANGVQLGVGSSAELLTTTDINKEQDVKTIQENALSAAWGYSAKASEYATMASLNSLGAQYQRDTRISQTIGAGLESIGKVADKWYYYNRGY